MLSRFVIRLAACCALALPAFAEVPQGPKNVPAFKPAFKNQTRAPAMAVPALKVEVIAQGLEHPWGMAVLPNGNYLVTERPGRLNYIQKNGKISRIKGTPKVHVDRQGGLLDVAIADDFASSRRVFLTYAKAAGRGRYATAAATGVLSKDFSRLSQVKDIYVQQPATDLTIHFGSRIVIDGNIAYITIGDRGRMPEAQKLSNPQGTVIRIGVNGGIPSNNPFIGKGRARPEIWSYGHRNPQGAAIHPRTGELWTLEHGPAGGDELNLIRAGGNYGWPVTSYGENYNGSPIGRGQTSAKGIEEPRYYWDPVIAPGGFAFYQGDLFDWDGDVIAASLSPGAIHRLKLKGNRVVGESMFLEDLRRVRDIEIDRDGAILALAERGSGILVRITPAK